MDRVWRRDHLEQGTVWVPSFMGAGEQGDRTLCRVHSGLDGTGITQELAVARARCGVRTPVQLTLRPEIAKAIRVYIFGLHLTGSSSWSSPRSSWSSS